MKELTPVQKALNVYRGAVADMVVAKQRETACAIACDKANEDFKVALAKACRAQDVADRARGELEALIAPQEPPEVPKEIP